MSKQSKRYTFIIVLLSVLLTISLVVGATFAWFVSYDSKESTITFGEAVTIRIETVKNEKDEEVLPISFNGAYLVPGMGVKLTADVNVEKSTTPAILRAKFAVKVVSENLEVDHVKMLEELILESVYSRVNPEWVKFRDERAESDNSDWFYYFDKDADAYTIFNSSNEPLRYVINQNIIEDSDLGTDNIVLKRVESSESDVKISLMQDIPFVFPTKVGNPFANTVIRISVTFQALQGVLPYLDPSAGQTIETHPDNELYKGDYYRKNSIRLVIDAFNGQNLNN